MPLFVTRRDRRVDSGFLCSQHIIADFLFFCFSNLEILSPFLSKLSSSFSVQTNRRSKKKKRTKRKKIVFFFDWTGSAIQTRTETECGTTTWATTNISRCFRAFLVCFCLFLFYSYYNVKMRETIIFVFFFSFFLSLLLLLFLKLFVVMKSGRHSCRMGREYSARSLLAFVEM